MGAGRGGGKMLNGRKLAFCLLLVLAVICKCPGFGWGNFYKKLGGGTAGAADAN